MLFDVLLLGYAIAIGFVAAGIVSSLYQLLTAQPVGFILFGESPVAIFASAVFFAICGPMLALQLALQGRRRDEGRWAWLIGGVVVASFWGGCIGILTLQVTLSLSHGFA